jgi:hypothetical protein
MLGLGGARSPIQQRSLTERAVTVKRVQMRYGLLDLETALQAKGERPEAEAASAPRRRSPGEETARHLEPSRPKFVRFDFF